MLARNDNPRGFYFNFAVDSVFNAKSNGTALPAPPSGNNFLLLDGTDFLLLDSTNFLLLET